MAQMEEQKKFTLTITAEDIKSTDDRFTIDDLDLGDDYKPLDAYFEKASGDVVRRSYDKGEWRNTNQTLPRLACQVYEQQIASMSVEDKEGFPVCKYKPEKEMIRGIYTSVEAYQDKYGTTFERLEYKRSDGGLFVIYSWNVFSTIVFVQECLKRFGEAGDHFVLIYKDKDANESHTPNEDCNYWWLNANPKIWSFSAIAVGERQSYTLYNENGNKRRVFQNFLDARKGDMIIGYESNPVKQIVALGKISAEQDGKKLYFEKTEGLTTPIDLATLKGCSELENMEYFQNAQGSLFKLTKEEYDCIIDLIRDENPAQRKSDTDSYSRKNFLDEVYMTEKRYNQLTGVLRNKKNIILQGAPGVGKTFAAKRLAYSMMGEKDDSRIEFVQFHQNYSYEDFMMGYKPVEDGFELKYGIFYQFCQKAANQPNKDYFFIIDEINRGNMSKIFGELLMLIERDYRGEKVTLAYNGLSFSVPKNLYIIGMMNTADRSLAMIDYALRRRFSFFEMEPGFEAAGFVKYRETLHSDTLDHLVSKVQELNIEITKDKSLGKGFCIGHSYFCEMNEKDCTKERLRDIVDYDILPMLAEYWFDDQKKLEKWDDILHGVF